MLLQEGFKLIRVRQEPLKKIYDTDVISKQPYNGKQVTNDVLIKIMELYTLPEKLVSKIKDYQAKEELQDERGLDRYIDKILTEKAEKNTNEQNVTLSIGSVEAIERGPLVNSRGPFVCPLVNRYCCF